MSTPLSEEGATSIQPLRNLSLHDYIKYFLAVLDRLIGDLRILHVGYPSLHSSVQSLNDFQQMLIEFFEYLVLPVAYGLLRELHIATPFGWIGNFQSHLSQDRIDLIDVVLASLLVGTSFQSPITIALGAF